MKKYITLMTGLGIIEVGITWYLTEWRHAFWDYIAVRDVHNFFLYLGIFLVVTLILCVVSTSATYVGNLAAIRWRKILNARAWPHQSVEVDNVNQRIQEDCREYPNLVITLGFGLCKALAYILVFSIILGVKFSIYYLLIISSYAIINTYIAKKIGRPLINLNYIFQTAEATYRNVINKVNFIQCTTIMRSLATRLKYLQYFQQLYGQFGVIIPIAIVAPAYFSMKLTLGGMMQAISIMSTVSENLSFGINSFDAINRLLACKKRLSEIGVIK